MRNKELELIASVYHEDQGAKTILDALERMHRAATITLKDAATVTKDGDGKLHVKETREVTTGKGARRGAIIAGIFGVIYPPSLIVSVLSGGIIGGAWGKLRDTGIKTGKMRELGDSLAPGNVAVIVLAEPEDTQKIEAVMEAYPGQFIRHAFTPEEAGQIEVAATQSADAPQE
jgi:uncharacterized membrane protein